MAVKVIDFGTNEGYRNPTTKWVINVLKKWRVDAGVASYEQYDYPELKEWDAEFVWAHPVSGIHGISGIMFRDEKKYMLFLLKYKK